MSKPRKPITPPVGPVSKAEALRFARWAVGVLGLNGWRISFVLSEETPTPAQADAQGCFEADPTRHIAAVWIHPTKATTDGDSLLGVIGHELVHIALLAAGASPGTAEDQPAGEEFFVNRIGDLLAAAYAAGADVPAYAYADDS